MIDKLTVLQCSTLFWLAARGVVFFTSYDEGTFNKTYDLGGTPVPYTETYDKETFAVSIGVDISL